MSDSPPAIHLHSSTLSAFKGIAIASSLLTAGQLGTITALLPSLYPCARTSHKLAAQQFASSSSKGAGSTQRTGHQPLNSSGRGQLVNIIV